MAKNTQEAEVIITMNGTAAKKAAAELRAEYERLTQAALDARKAGNDALGDKLDADARKLMKDIEITRRETKKFADVMKNINGASLKELRSAAKQLQSEINKLAPGTQVFIEKSKQLQQVNTRIRQLTNEFKGLVVEEKQATFSLKGLADGFNKYFGMVTAGIAAVTGMSMAFRKAAEDAARLDDVYSDVMKTTGLLHEQVADLDKELMKIDTRTSREQLLLLARDAGKLGIQGKENILGFVRAADQIQVALGEDLGEGAIRNLGKISDVLGYTSSLGIEKSLLSIGSAINAVGQASTASESYLVDFTQRMAGEAAQTGISAANIIGFASGLDQSAMKVEMASTAFQKFLMKLYEDPAKFAAYANLEVGKFTDLLKNDANQAVITILKALKDQDGFASLVPIFKDMGLDGARAVSVLAAMATNINAVTDAQALANEEFAKATSVTEEYNVKNNNMQAQLEKARKEFQNASIALGQSLNPIMVKSTKLTTYLVKALAQYGKEIRNATIAVAAVTLAIKRQAAAQTALNVVQKVGYTLRATGNTIIWAARTAFLRLIGATEAATIAQQQLNAAMSASVFGVIALAIGGLTMAITHWVKKSREAAEVTDYLVEAEKQANEEYAEQAGKVRALTSIVENNNIALGERKKALNELKSLVPGYHADLTEEGRLINNNKTAIDDYCKSLREQIRLKAREEQLLEIEKQIAALEDQKASAQERQHQALVDSGGDTKEKDWGKHSWFTGKLEYTPYGQAKADEADIDKQIAELEKQAEKIGDKAAELSNKIAEDTRVVVEEEQEKTNAILSQAQFDYLQERSDKLTKKEKEMVEAGYAALSEEDSKALKSRYDKLIAAGRKATDQRYQQELKAIEASQRNEEIILKRGLMNREISQAEYNAKMNLLVMQGLQKRIELAKRYGQDETKYASQLLDEEIKLIGDGMEEIQEKMSYMPTTPKPGDVVDPQANEEFWEKVMSKRDEIVSSLKDQSLKDDYDNEMRWIEKLHEQELLTEEQFQRAKLETKIKYLQEYSQQYNTIQEQASNFVNALKEYETQKAEAEYQAQLTAAGDNAEQREAVEAAYEQKKLDIQKKYADTEMVINIAKTVAAGALAAIQAFAQLGPIGGAVAAALIAVNTALEVATIVQQRNAIKNASVSSSGSSSVPKTGERKMTGYAEGGYTEDHTTLTTVGEKGREWVGPAWMVRKNPVMFANLERYRKSGSHGRSGSISKGFTEGGYTGQPTVAKNATVDVISKADLEEAVETAISRSMANGAIRAYLVRKDLTELDAQDARFKAQTSRG